MEITQIVPYLPPKISGVGDYAWLLAKELADAHGINTSFVVTDADWSGEETSEGFPVARLPCRDAGSLADALTFASRRGALVVLLHYVGYGYQKRGCPVWLLSGVRRWLRGSSQRRLVTMFHELYATGPIQTSAFWLSSIQRWLFGSLARVSNACVTNRAASALEIERARRSDSDPVLALPVFSNVGEPPRPAPPSHRLPRLVVFGGARWKEASYGTHRSELLNACRRLGVDEIVDVGAPAPHAPSLPLRWTSVGELSAVEVSRWLNESRAGFVPYPADFLAKSGIFAAVAAHALVPVIPDSLVRVNADGLAPNRHFLVVSADGAASELANYDTIAEAARDWYWSHSLVKQAAFFYTVLTQNQAFLEVEPLATG